MSKKLQKSSEYSNIFNSIIDICNEKGISVTSLIEKFASSRSAITAWKNGTINADIIPKLAQELNVSVDYLLTGKENNPIIDESITECIKLFSQLSEIDKGRILNEMENYIKNNKEQ